MITEDLSAEYDRRKRAWWAIPVNKICAKCKRKSDKSPHHIRGRLGRLLILIEFWLPVCRKCHNWIHQNPNAARELGMLAMPGDWNKIPRKNEDENEH